MSPRKNNFGNTGKNYDALPPLTQQSWQRPVIMPMTNTKSQRSLRSQTQTNNPPYPRNKVQILTHSILFARCYVHPLTNKFKPNDSRYMHSSRNKKRIIIKDDKNCHRYYDDRWKVTRGQIHPPERVRDVLLQSLHGSAYKHPQTAKRIQDVGQKNYVPSKASDVGNWVRECKIWLKHNCINNTQIELRSIFNLQRDLGLEDLTQIDVLQKLPENGGCEIIKTAEGESLRQAIVYPVSNPTEVNITKVRKNIRTQFVCLHSK